MSANTRTTSIAETISPAVSGTNALWLLGGAVLGAVIGAVLVPTWLPDLTASLLGPSPKAYWYISRSSGVVAFLLLWFSLVFGLLITGKLSRLWPGGPTTVDLHQFSGLLGLAFVLVHALILLGDRYASYSLINLLVPFASASYRPFAVGLGQVAFYLGLVVGLSFYVRSRIGFRVWRLLHFGSFGLYALSAIHGLTAGTDANGLYGMYVVTTLVTLFLTFYRILISSRRLGLAVNP